MILNVLLFLRNWAIHLTVPQFLLYTYQHDKWNIKNKAWVLFLRSSQSRLLSRDPTKNPKITIRLGVF